MTCKYPTCSNDVGQQDRDDYRKRTFCSIQHEVKYDHLKMDAKDAQESVKEEVDTVEGYF
jgi:hypothetical protein